MIYFDSAATTLQKPPSVARAMVRTMKACASPGRGGHPPANRAAEAVYRCRQEAAGLFGMDDPQRVVFTSSATHALNLAIKSVAAPGDRVLVSGYEHNAVLRPLAAIGNIRVEQAAAPLFDRAALLESFLRRIDGVSAVICTHVSNVFGFILPVEEIGALCRERQIPFVVDAAQSAGLLPLSFPRLGADFVAMPGHKSLYGPQGTGLLLCGERPVRTILEGGTGSLSALSEMPDFLPDRLEAGTHNVPGIAGLREGIRFVRARGPEHILRHERQLAGQLVGALSQLPGVTVCSGGPEESRSGVVSFCVRDTDCETLGDLLAGEGICVRAGLHCAPAAHRSAGTLETGTVRVSFSIFNTPAQVRQFCTVLRRLIR